MCDRRGTRRRSPRTNQRSACSGRVTRGHEHVTRPHVSSRTTDHRPHACQRCHWSPSPRSGRRDSTRASPCPAEPRRASRADSSCPSRSITPALIVWRSEKSSTLRDCSMTSGSGVPPAAAMRSPTRLNSSVADEAPLRDAYVRPVLSDVRRLPHHPATEVRRRRLRAVEEVDLALHHRDVAERGERLEELAERAEMLPQLELHAVVVGAPARWCRTRSSCRRSPSRTRARSGGRTSSRTARRSGSRWRSGTSPSAHRRS